MISVFASLPLAIIGLLDQPPDPSTIVIIAVANAVVWVGLFLFLLWRLSRGTKQLDARLDSLEEKIVAEEKSEPKK